MLIIIHTSTFSCFRATTMWVVPFTLVAVLLVLPTVNSHHGNKAGETAITRTPTYSRHVQLSPAERILLTLVNDKDVVRRPARTGSGYIGMRRERRNRRPFYRYRIRSAIPELLPVFYPRWLSTETASAPVVDKPAWNLRVHRFG